MWALSALDLDLVPTQGPSRLASRLVAFGCAEGTIAVLFRTRTPDWSLIAKQEVVRFSAARVGIHGGGGVGKQLDPLNNVSVHSKGNKNLPQSIHNVKHIFDSSLLNVTWLG
jgi:hypothetical protein